MVWHTSRGTAKKAPTNVWLGLVHGVHVQCPGTYPGFSRPLPFGHSRHSAIPPAGVGGRQTLDGARCGGWSPISPLYPCTGALPRDWAQACSAGCGIWPPSGTRALPQPSHRQVEMAAASPSSVRPRPRSQDARGGRATYCATASLPGSYLVWQWKDWRERE